LHLTGLERLKNVTLDIYERLFRLQGMDASKRPAETLNFLFLGNPGTGKTTVARLFGKLLIELGVRKSDGAFNETSGNKLKQMGRTKAEELVENSIGGVLFVDEAYDLNPQDSQGGGKEILDHIMEIAEKNRLDISIILAGCTTQRSFHTLEPVPHVAAAGIRKTWTNSCHTMTACHPVFLILLSLTTSRRLSLLTSSPS
jgi:stage V sporulation protein K